MNAEGNRVRKTIDGTVVINYLVDTNRDYAQVLEERDDSGKLLARYVYGHDLISQTRETETSYYHYDGLGSTRALTNAAGVVTDTYTYDAFGNLLDKTGVTVNEYLYTGEFFDSHLNFYYLRARYLNAALGRFVTMDTFAGRSRDPLSLHKYLYAHANPVNRVDPSGQMSTLNEMTVSAGIIGALSGIAIYHVTHDPEERNALGYVTWGAGGALAGALVAQSVWYLWLAPPAASLAEPTIKTIDKPLQVALGRWDNLTSYWKNLVEGRHLYHLQLKDGCKNVLQRSLALGDEVFARITEFDAPRIIQETKDFLLRPNVTRIYIDLNRIKSALNFPGIPAWGYFAKEELRMIVENPQLMDKTIFIKMGQVVTPSQEYLQWLLE